MNQSIQSIQFLRFVAATLVVLVHAVEGLQIYFPAEVSSTLAYFAGAGASGVHIFFVISGFVMVYTTFSEPRPSPKEFISKRIFRIYPIYFVYCVGYILYYSKLTTEPHPGPLELLASLLLVPGYSALIIGPGWTLSYELYFYLCFALILFLPGRRGLTVLTVFFLISIVAGLFVQRSGGILRVVTSSLLVEFLFGSWIAYFFSKGASLSTRIATLSALLGVAGFAIGLAFGYSRVPSLISWGIPSAFLLTGLVFLERNEKSSWIVRRVAFLGDSSYSLYLLHVLIIDVVLLSGARFWDLSKIPTMSLVVGLTVLCVAVSAVAYSLVERRLLRSLHGVWR